MATHNAKQIWRKARNMEQKEGYALVLSNTILSKIPIWAKAGQPISSTRKEEKGRAKLECFIACLPRCSGSILHRATRIIENRLQWFSQPDGIHQQKDAKKYSLKCLFKKFFNWLSHFLRICILPFPKYTHIWTTFFYFFFNIWVSKNEKFYTDFQSVEIIWKKCT